MTGPIRGNPLRFVERREVVEAQQWTPADAASVGPLLTWLMSTGAEPKIVDGVGGGTVLGGLCVPGVADGDHWTAPPSHYIVRNLRWGMFHALDPDEFHHTYEEMS